MSIYSSFKEAVETRDDAALVLVERHLTDFVFQEPLDDEATAIKQILLEIIQEFKERKL